MRTSLTVNGVQLLDHIDSSNAFVDQLGAVGCITWPQREHIINIVQPRDRNDKLLEFLTRRSVADFQKFINVLAKEQNYLVPLLLTDGGETSDCNFQALVVEIGKNLTDRLMEDYSLVCRVAAVTAK